VGLLRETLREKKEKIRKIEGIETGKVVLAGKHDLQGEQSVEGSRTQLLVDRKMGWNPLRTICRIGP